MPIILAYATPPRRMPRWIKILCFGMALVTLSMAVSWTINLSHPPTAAIRAIGPAVEQAPTPVLSVETELLGWCGTCMMAPPAPAPPLMDEWVATLQAAYWNEINRLRQPIVQSAAADAQ